VNWTALLQPDAVLDGSVTSLTPAFLQQHRLQGLILDVDRTLVPLNSRRASEELQQWVAQVRPNVQLWLVSNNLGEARIRSIASSLELPYLSGAAKPSRRKLRQALAGMALPAERAAMVGDRLFTDVLAGNRLGLFTILVEPVRDPQAGDAHPVRDAEVWLSQRLGVSLARARLE